MVVLPCGFLSLFLFVLVLLACFRMLCLFASVFYAAGMALTMRVAMAQNTVNAQRMCSIGSAMMMPSSPFCERSGCILSRARSRCGGDLWGTGFGTVLTVDRRAFMHVAGGYWLRADTPWVTVSDEDLYVCTLVNGVDLACAYIPYRRSCSL